MNDFRDQVRGIVDDWPEAGYVVGVLPDRSDPTWSGRAVLELIEAADRAGGPSVLVDLAPGGTDLDLRFEAGGGPGLAEMVEGEVELWEISHRSDVHRAVYVPEGSSETGSELAGSETTARLAEQMRDRGRLLVVVLDRGRAEAAAAAGYLDGVVRIGEADGADGADEHEGVAELGRITGRPGDGGPGERRRMPETRDGPRLVLPPEMRSEHRRRRRIRRGLMALAALVAVGLVVSSLLGGPGIGDLLSGSDGPSVAVQRADAGQEGREETAAPDSLADGPPSPSDTAAGTAADVGASESAAGDTAATAGDSLSTAADLPESGGPPDFRAVADSLALSIREFSLRAERFRAGEIGCGALIEARRRTDRLFERLWMEHMSLQPAPDSPAAATFRERSRQMETVESAYAATSCPAEAIGGS